MNDEVIRFTVPGAPVPKGRPRARIVTPHGRPAFITFYTPKETEVYEEAVSWCAKGAMGGAPPLEESCDAVVRAYIAIPTSWTNKKKGDCLLGLLRPPSSPDIDNYVKAALDGCNGIIFKDDSLIWRIIGEKIYSDNPRLEVEIRKFVPATLI